MKIAAKKMDTRSVTETVETKRLVIKVIVLDEVDNYPRIALKERGMATTRVESGIRCFDIIAFIVQLYWV